MKQFRLEARAGFEPPCLRHAHCPLARLCQVKLPAPSHAPGSLEGGAGHLRASLGVDIFAADTLAVLGAGNLGLIALAVVLETPGPLAVAALVMSSVALRRVFANLGLESIGISVKTLFDGPRKCSKFKFLFKNLL